ncbi:MAG: regulator of chromosome condensation [Massilia sp.]|nr:regulator of chromosome condensation [Massilia sp.]
MTIRHKCRYWAKTIASIALGLSISTAVADTTAKPGVWYGTLGIYPIIVCIESGKAAYYYPGQSADIDLDVKNGKWIETSHGETTGQWTIKEEPTRIEGIWRKPRGKVTQPINLNKLGDFPSACSSAVYRQALLLPDEPRLSLPLPQSGQVAALRHTAAVVKPNGELWMWSENQRQPKLVGKDYLRVALGAYHTVAIKADGSLWGWGSNVQGQLGGADVNGDQPVHMGDGFVAVAANEAYSLAVRKDGTLWSWGGAAQGTKGELLDTLKKPQLMGKSFVSVSAGDASFAALKSDGSLWMWGRDNDGQLGFGSEGSWHHRQYGYENLPALVSRDFAAVSAGYAHTAAVRSDGTLWTWGHGTWGKLGNGSEGEGSRVPVNIGSGYVLAVAGYLNSAALKADGSLWLWGGNQLGMFGDCTTKTHSKPVQVGTGFMQAALGADFLVALKPDGSVWTWGWSWDGDQMDTPRACRKPAKVVFGDGVNAWDKAAAEPIRMKLAEPRGSGDVVSIAAGESHSAMARANGSLWTWGSNEYGQLATGTTAYRNLPERSGNDVAEVYTDANHTLALKKDGSLWRWGAIGSQYPHGDLPISNNAAIAPVKVFSGTVRLLHSGYQMGRGLGLSSDGAILDWLYYWDSLKQPVEFGRDVREIAAARFRSYAIRTDGSLWELEQYPVKPPPKQVGKDFVHVVSGADHAYGIKADGSLWAWGENNMHQLGDGTRATQADPVKIGSGFVQVATGRFHGIALASDGSVWTWGDNETGVIGDGTTVAHPKPVKIGTGFVKIAAGDYHNLALKANGTLWAWGNNEDGQLGDGTHARRPAPIQVYPPVADRKAAVPATAMRSSVTSVRTGLVYSCAFYRDDSAKCWGSNGEGQLGNDRRLGQNPKPIAVDNKEMLLNRLASGTSRRLACTAAQAKQCARIEAKHPFLRGARMIVDDSTLLCALMKNGKIRCSYQPTVSSEKFVVDGVHDAVQFDFSYGHGCALQADGRVKCWGDNSHGELGNGTIVTSHSNYRRVATEVVEL